MLRFRVQSNRKYVLILWFFSVNFKPQHEEASFGRRPEKKPIPSHLGSSQADRLITTDEPTVTSDVAVSRPRWSCAARATPRICHAWRP